MRESFSFVFSVPENWFWRNFLDGSSGLKHQKFLYTNYRVKMGSKFLKRRTENNANI